MIATEDLVAQQERIGKDIENTLNTYPKGKTPIQKIPSIMVKLATLDAAWVNFVTNHEEIKIRLDIDGGHEYFKHNYYDSVKNMVAALQEIISTTILETTNQDLKIDLINRGSYAFKRMYNDKGEKVIPTQILHTETEQPRIEDISNSERSSEGHSEQDEQGPFTNIVLPDVRNFINSSHNSGSAKGSIAVGNLKLALEAVEQAAIDFQQIPQDTDDVSTIGELAEHLLDQWSTAVRWQDRLISAEMEQYDSSEFFKFQRRMRPILQQAKQIYNKDHDSHSNGRNRKDKSIKMNPIELTKFNGDYTKWTVFKDLFEQMINQRDLTKAEKFMYLRSNLTGEALNLIKSLRVTADNYDIAWQMLNERYENPRQIMKSMLNKIFNMDKAKGNSFASLKSTHDNLNENILAVQLAAKNEKELLDMIFHQLILNKIDSTTHTLYEQNLNDTSAPVTKDGLLTFIRKRFQALENIGNEHQRDHPKDQQRDNQQPKFGKFRSTVLNAAQDKSCECKEKHPVYKCPIFLAMTPQERYKKIRNSPRCINCFRLDHSSKDCKSRKCNKCDKLHNSLLHFERKKSTALLGSAIKNPNFQHVFLGTALINVNSKYGTPIKMRALLDSGAQVSIMSERMFKKTGLAATSTKLEITGVGNASAKADKMTTIQLSSEHSNYKANLEVYIMPTVTSCQPINKVDIENWKIPKSIQLADPEFNRPANVDILIGGELFYRLLVNGLINIGKGLPDLQNTVFGWVVIGKLLGLKSNQSFVGMAITEEPSLGKQLENFWKIEEKDGTTESFSTNELACEQFYESTTKRQTDGRFIVKLQFTKEPELLGNSKDMAIRRFIYLEKRFNRDTQLKAEYVKFMKEYLELGHMEIVTDKNIIEGPNYVIPHHAVMNPSSSTTKFRVVFDASATTTTGTSLNKILANGPMLQDDLFTIMIRFRIFTYVFSSDIGKMYRQIMVAPEDQKWQLIVWRESPTSELKYYKLKTLTYGTTCASYLAIKTLQQLATIEKDNFPLASIVAKRDFNVDDVMTGSNDILEAVECQQQLISMLKLGGMDLHKWCANHPMLLEAIPDQKREISLDINSEKTETKALGMKWIPKEDIFTLHYNPKEHTKITKRTVLSETAQLFDPLGLVNPVIVKAKVFIQELWQDKMDWDEILPAESQNKWVSYRKELASLTKIIIPRHAFAENPVTTQLHAFSDASERAYGAAIYIRTTTENGETKIHLLCSKSRVAPVNKISLPRMELCGAVTMVNLVKKLKKEMGITFDKITYWTDSEIVLSWLYNETPYKTFVANRVASIKRKTSVNEWRYIDTKNNPADIVSRGCTTNELHGSSLWWNGPEFLSQSEKQWPEIKPAFRQEPAEEKVVKSILTASTVSSIIGDIQHRNSITTLQRVVAYCIKFGTKTTGADDQQFGSLSKEHLKKAMIEIIKFCQRAELSEDIAHIENNHPEKTKFRTMTPIIDSDGVLRVGGRLQKSTLQFEERHPAILPYHHEITRMIMQKIHQDNMHAGPQALLATTRQKYWPIKGKVLAKSIVDSCVLCTRAKPKLLQQVMGTLPKDRVTMSRPFLISGCDYAGPITIHHKGRGSKTVKAYVCIFVCFATKAIHIEVASDLTSQAFLCCLKRFIARRGQVQKIYSDNATNFTAANKQLTELAALMASGEHQQQLNEYCNDHQIEWRFIPPRSPHFGGLWESAVKSAKNLLTKVLHNHQLTYDELSTVLTEIEAILNSRPLSPLSDDANDMQPLTAGHFLIGSPLTAINDGIVENSTRLKQWAKLVQIKKDFWQRWSKEYLCELQYKTKWRAEHPNIKIGTLVILKDINLPPLMWRLGRITELVPDKDGLVRVVYVKTSTGIFQRAIHELAPLPVETTEEVPEAITTKPTLNVEAPEFEWNLNQPKPEIETISKKEIKKVTQKRRGRPKGKKTTAAKPIQETITPRTTRSGRKFGAIHIMLMAAAFFSMIIGTLGQQCNYTTFNHNPGLYFENNGKLSLTSDKWNIIGFIKLESYWRQQTQMKTLHENMEEVCGKIANQEHCHILTSQFKRRYSVLVERNDIFRSFSNPPAVRKRRGGWSKEDWMEDEDISNLTQNEWPNIKEDKTTNEEKKAFVKWHSNKINMIKKETAQPENVMRRQKRSLYWKVLKRERRGWANILGSGLHQVTGVMDDDDAIRINAQISSLNNSNAYLLELIANQTSIQDMTQHIIKKEEITMNQQFAYLENEIKNIQDANQAELNTMFTTLTLQLQSLMNTHSEVQNSIIDLLSHVHHGRLSPTILSPQQLKNHLEKIARSITNNLMIPGDGSATNIAKMYALMDTKIRITTHRIMIKTTIPLLQRDVFDLHHVIPVPFYQNGVMNIITTQNSFIAVNARQDRYYTLTHQQKAACKIFSDDMTICEQTDIVYNTQSGVAKCEMAILTHLSKGIPPKCRIAEVKAQQMWSKLDTPNQFLFTIESKTMISIICGGKSRTCSIEGSGIIPLEPQCMLHTGNMEIASTSEFESEEPIIIAPKLNITNVLEEIEKTKSTNVAKVNYQIDPELDALSLAIDHQKTAEHLHPSYTMHHAHHYTMIYVVLGIAIACGLWKKFGKTIRNPANRSRHSEESTRSHELQEIHIHNEAPIPTARFARPAVLEEWSEHGLLGEK